MRPILVAALVVLVGACGPDLTPSAASTPIASPSVFAASGPRIAPPPVTPPTPPGSNLPEFACKDASGGKTGVANVTAARVEEQTEFDRFVLQMDSIVPTYTVTRQAKPVFAQGASGQSITLKGTAGVLVTVHSATGATTFTGATDIVYAKNQVLVEARQVQDFEGYVSWGLGLTQPTCMRVFTLDSPARLVVDFQILASSSGTGSNS